MLETPGLLSYYLSGCKLVLDRLKLGHDHQILINSEPPHNNASVQVWIKSINWSTSYRVRKTNLNSYELVTLEIRSRSPKSYQL